MGNGNGSFLEQGPQPGMILDTRTGQWIQARSISSRIFYDTEQIVTPITAGVSYFFFRNLNFPAGARKTSVFTNMRTEQLFPSGWLPEIHKIGFRVLKLEEGVPAVFPTAEDMIRVLSEGAMTFTIGGQRIEAEGRLDMFPSGNGLNLFANSAAPIVDLSMVNNGVPSLAAVPDLPYPIKIANQNTFEVEVEFARATTLDADVYLLCELHTTLIQPIL